MPEFYIKKGLADVELKNWITDHKDEPFVKVDIDIESSHERLRRSFHGLLRDWFDSGEWSANGERIKTIEALRDYYKLEGCSGVPEWYRFGKFNTKVREEITDYIAPEYHRFIVEDPKSWTKMNKKQKSNSLNLLLTEIKHSMTNNQKVLKRVAEITGDFEMLADINYHKNIKG
ncbi:MAG: hypothetical protein GY787_14440 [Alteromonadales bacterium]|nr:hypothetical protein [Alteromonadales bacterium]